MGANKEEYIEIDLLRILRTMWKHMAVVVLAIILCGVAGFGIAYGVIPPEYESSALLYVNNSSISVGSTSISLSDLSASQTLVDTYIAILNTRLTLNEVQERLGLDYTYKELKKMIEAKAVNGTEIFEITVTSDTPEEAERIANTIVEVLPDKIAQVVDGSSVRTVDFAVVPEKRSGPSITLFTAAGLLIGALLSCGVITLRETMDTQIHSEEYLLQTYDLPVLAVVPDLLAQQSGGYRKYGAYYAAVEGERP